MKTFIWTLTIAIILSAAGYCFATDPSIFGYVSAFDFKKGEVTVNELDKNDKFQRPTGKKLVISDNEKKILSASDQSKVLDRYMRENEPFKFSASYKVVGGKNVVVRYRIIRGGC